MAFCRYVKDVAIDVAILHEACVYQHRERELDHLTMRNRNMRKQEKGLPHEYSEHDLHHNEELHKEVLEWQVKPTIDAALKIVNAKLDEISSKELVFLKSNEKKLIEFTRG